MADSSSPKKKSQQQQQQLQQHLHQQKQKQRYHRLPKDDHHDDFVVGYDKAVAVVDEENQHVNTNCSHSTQTTPNGKSNDTKQAAKNPRSTIFRAHTWTAEDNPTEFSSIISNTHSNDLADLHAQREHQIDNDDDDHQNDHSMESSPLHSTVHSKSFDWDDEDEEEAGLSRYHVVVNTASQGYLPQHYASIHNNNPNTVSSSFLSISSFWRQFQQLRMAARQRRAARLLSSSEDNSCCFPCRACILTYCCDATDHGILLLFVLILLWILIGITSWSGNKKDRPYVAAWWWWGGGILLFVIRVSARRLWEAMFMLYRKRSFSSADQDTVAIMMMATTTNTPTAISTINTTTTTNSMRRLRSIKNTSSNRIPREVASVHDDDDDDHDEFHDDSDDYDRNGRHPV